MGEARRRRAALRHAGLPADHRPTPGDFVELRVLVTRALNEMIDNRHEMIEPEKRPTRGDFVVHLLVAGLQSFDRYAASQREKDALIAQPSAKDIALITKGGA